MGHTLHFKLKKIFTTSHTTHALIKTVLKTNIFSQFREKILVYFSMLDRERAKHFTSNSFPKSLPDLTNLFQLKESII